MLTTQQGDFLSAGLRHLRDAEHLAEPGETQSLDQAWHLGGFAAECLRKSGLRAIDHPLGREFSHSFEKETELGWLLTTDPWAHRYELDGWAARCTALQRWTEQHRYDRTGGVDRSADVTDLLAFCRARADDLLFRLFADGHLPVEFR